MLLKYIDDINDEPKDLANTIKETLYEEPKAKSFFKYFE